MLYTLPAYSEKKNTRPAYKLGIVDFDGKKDCISPYLP